MMRNLAISLIAISAAFLSNRGLAEPCLTRTSGELAPVHVQFDDRAFTIPYNYFLPFRPLPERNNFLIIALWPSMERMTDANRSKFLAPGVGSSLAIWVGSSARFDGVEHRTDAILKLNDLAAPTRIGDVAVYEPRKDARPDRAHEVVIERMHGQPRTVVECDSSVGALSTGCTMVFADRGLLFEVQFGEHLESSWSEIRKAVSDLAYRLEGNHRECVES